MSLDDRFNPNDGSFIDKVDNAIYTLNKGIAKKWQDITYSSKRGLETALYLSSSAALTYSACVDPKMLYLTAPLAAISALMASFKDLRPKSSLQEEVSSEFFGLPRKFNKFVNSSAYILGGSCAFLSFSKLFLLGDYVYEDTDLEFLSSSAGNLGIHLWATANYVSRSNIGPPPPKHKRKSIPERIKDLLGRLLPKPSTNQSQ